MCPGRERGRAESMTLLVTFCSPREADGALQHQCEPRVWKLCRGFPVPEQHRRAVRQLAVGHVGAGGGTRLHPLPPKPHASGESQHPLSAFWLPLPHSVWIWGSAHVWGTHSYLLPQGSALAALSSATRLATCWARCRTKPASHS